MSTYTVQINPSIQVNVVALPVVTNIPELLTYRGGGGNIFNSINNNILRNDLANEPGLYHGANPLIEAEFSKKSCTNLAITTEKKKILSAEQSRGLFEVEYSVNGNTTYYWSDVYTTPVGIYTVSNSVFDSHFTINKEFIEIETNNVNIIPKIGDYILLNEIPSGTLISGSPFRLQLYRGTEILTAKVLEVLVIQGVGVDVRYKITIDKTFDLKNSDIYSIVLLNRFNTGIQKELFYETFEQIEIHQRQLLGDPYININNSNKPLGRKNFLEYGGSDALGYRNLLRNIINEKETPIIVYDLNDEIKDRISYDKNTYTSSNLPLETNFELHLPGVLINDNVIAGSSVDFTGNIMENIFVIGGNIKEELIGVGKYSGLYLKGDTQNLNRYGYVFFDLRIIVIDHSELSTALGYNSNRNYTLPKPEFKIGSANSVANKGIGLDLSISDATNTSPIIITTSIPHRLTRGTKIVIKNVQGNTSANGEWFVDLVYNAQGDRERFELWAQLPQYDPSGIRVQPVGGVPSAGNGIFINNGAGNSGKIIGALPAYSFFYTYRLRNKQNESTMPYSEIVDFNFAKGGLTDNSTGNLSINIPSFNWAKGQSHLNPYGLGFNLLQTFIDSGYGIDIIIGEYNRNPNDPINPNKIIGIKNIMCLPIGELNESFFGDPFTQLSIEIKKFQDFDKAVSDTANNVRNYEYDILNNFKHYTFQNNILRPNLNTGNGKWTIGECIFRNRADITRTTFSIDIPADKWNDSSNPTFKPTQNELIKDKFISEVGILLIDEAQNESPMVYAKICPPVRKNNDLDLQIKLNVDF